MLPGIGGTISNVARLSSSVYQQAYTIDEFPKSLMTVETVREVATMIMLLSVAVLAARGWRERWAIFLWTFALWDLSYYLSLRITTGWPTSLTNLDVLFLIPVPWLAQVWFPILVSVLTALAALAGSMSAASLRPTNELSSAGTSKFRSLFQQGARWNLLDHRDSI